MMKLRIDVDYPFPSRMKSFIYVALRLKHAKKQDYLKNACILAQMINESSKTVRAYWFFTPYTIPDEKLLALLNTEKHEVALHVANNPFKELKTLENETNRKVKYYTIHGTNRFVAKLLWGRKPGQSQAIIPEGFPLISFHTFPTMSLDRERYLHGCELTANEIPKWVEQGIVMSMHPEWLFDKNDKTKRGPYYDVLKNALAVEKEFDTITIQKKLAIRIARDFREYYKNVVPTEDLLFKLKTRSIDIFTFIDRKWCHPVTNPPLNWVKTDDNIGLLEIKDYQTWWHSISKKTRNMVRKAEKEGVKVSIVSQSDDLARGIWQIYNETPIRQGRAFPHFGESLETVTNNMYSEKFSTFIGAYIGEELVGFIQILHGDNIAVLSNILSMQKYWDKAVNNALLAKAVEVCQAKSELWLMYGRIGNHPSLDRFKESNGFIRFPVSRYYVPLTSKGRIAIKLGLHKELKDALPDSIKYPLLPLVNWFSRLKVRIKILKFFRNPLLY
ncbi:MAG: hypothetical protein GX648_04215 [Crenarchaeota archaeon]|nr:hypothetical protein [Thermoproteota archaeon]